MLFHTNSRSNLGRHVTGFALKHSRTTLLSALAFAIAALWITGTQLEFHTERSDLLNPNSEFHQRWLEYVREFGSPEEVIVVVAGEPTEVRKVMDRLGPELQQQPDSYQDVYYRFDSEALRAKGLYYLNREQLIELDRWLAHVVPVLRPPSVRLTDLLSALNNITRSSGFRVVSSTQAEQVRGGIPTASSHSDWAIPWPVRPIAESRQTQWPDYQTLQDGQMGLITMHLVPNASGFIRGRDPIERLREQLQRMDDANPQVEIGLTGLPVIEYDEMRISQSDMTWASIISLIGVALLFAAAFGTLREPAWATACLLLAIAWTCGYLTVAVGHLNILSISFGVILIGLGIDFSIHYIARYRAIHQDEPSPSAALLEASSSVTPAILIGGLTTSVAFFAAAGTEFLGLAELGLIAGGGILLCLLATLIVLPAFIARCSPADTERRPTPLIRIDQWMAVCWRNPKRTIGAGVVLTLCLSGGLPHVDFDHNLLHLQAEGLESVSWEQRLLEKTQRERLVRNFPGR